MSSLSSVGRRFCWALLLAVLGAPQYAAAQQERPSLSTLLLGEVAVQGDELWENEAAQGCSVGTTSSGRLQEGVALERNGERLKQLPTHLDRGRHYTATNLAAFLDEISATLYEYRGVPLYYGDASAPSGGDISGHASHNAGRDIDLAYPMLSETGESLEPERFEKFRSNGRCRKCEAQFDALGMWQVVAAALESEHAQVQWIFVYHGLRKQILEAARAEGASAELIERASYVLRQPSDSASHNDHIHLRVLCSARDRVLGCQNRGPNWPWNRPHEGAAVLAGEALLASLRSESEQVIVERLEVLEAPALALPIAERMLAEPAMTQSLLPVLEASRISTESVPVLFTLLAELDEPRLRARILGQIGRIGENWTGELVAWGRAHPEDAAAVARSLSRMGPKEGLFPVWIEMLGHQDQEVSSMAQEALSLIANRQLPKQGWELWWTEQGQADREAWLIQGFQNYGVPIESLEDLAAVEGLIALQEKESTPEFVAENANRVLVSMLEHWVSHALKPEKRAQKWRKWWKKNAWRFETE